MNTDKKIPFGIALRESTLKVIDETRGDVSRTRIIERVLEERLGIPQVVERRAP